MIKIKKQKPSLFQIWRETLGMSKREVSKITKTTEMMYSLYERRKNIPTLKPLKRLHDFYKSRCIEGVSYDAIINDLLRFKK